MEEREVMITCSRILEFDAGHRVLNHESKCRTPHGHRYKVEITATAKELDTLGRIVDFGEIKATLGAWIDQHWDHTMIICDQDPMLEAFKADLHAFKPPYITEWNPTAENMASFLLAKASSLLKDTYLTITSVIVWETPNCKAEATKHENSR